MATKVSICRDILLERRRQDEKWGEQNHQIVEPDTDALGHLRLIVDRCIRGWISAAESCRDICKWTDSFCRLSWADILLEEVCEALDETDPVKRRYEMVQAAAVLVAMIESEDRRMAKEVENG